MECFVVSTDKNLSRLSSIFFVDYLNNLPSSLNVFTIVLQVENFNPNLSAAFLTEKP